jgi:hypothetical protein
MGKYPLVMGNRLSIYFIYVKLTQTMFRPQPLILTPVLTSVLNLDSLSYLWCQSRSLSRSISLTSMLIYIDPYVRSCDPDPYPWFQSWSLILIPILNLDPRSRFLSSISIWSSILDHDPHPWFLSLDPRFRTPLWIAIGIADRDRG